MHFNLAIASAVIGFAVLSSAHPGEHEVHNKHADIKKREFRLNTRSALSACADKLERRGVNARAQARRQATVDMHRKKKMIRDTDTVLNTSHASTTNYTTDTSEKIIFSQNSTCVLNPEGETGPVSHLISQFPPIHSTDSLSTG
jgi:hypothetical protein